MSSVGKSSFAVSAGERFDVVICGGGLAGLTLARQLARSQPDQSIILVERTKRPLDEATHKVGESSVELGSQYLERLGLREYLRERHLIKYGLRFFPGGGQRSIEERTEVGAGQEPIVASYQLDRGRLENDLRAMVEEDGVTLLEGVKVGAIELSSDDEPHHVELINLAGSDLDSDGAPSSEQGRTTVEARWVVDASGRASLIRKRLKLTRGTRHPANACWFRVDAALDLTNFAGPEATRWHEASWAPHRWRSTNHLMGTGYWAWIIPLSSGRTSIGIVLHDEHHDFDRIRSQDRALAFLREFEPQLAEKVDEHEILDFGCLRNYSYNTARAWSADRWATVGEAGAFADPFYSPGTDFIALSNSFTVEMIRCDFEEGHDRDARIGRARELSAIYRSLLAGSVDLYRDAAYVYGHPDSLVAKIYWDNFVYWSYPCQLFQQEMYRASGDTLLEMMPIGMRFADLTRGLQRLFDGWAKMAPVEPESTVRLMPAVPSVLVDAHLDLEKRLSFDETLDLMRSRLEEAEEIAGELVLRALDAVGEEQAEALVEHAGLLEWGVTIAESRIAAAETIGLARRRAFGPIAKDVERSVGRAPHKTSEATLRRLLAPIIRYLPVEETG